MNFAAHVVMRRRERALLPWLSAQLRHLVLGSEAGPIFVAPVACNMHYQLLKEKAHGG